MSDAPSPSFLSLIQKATRGRFKIYLGFAPGVGKTWKMLQEARALRAEGVDVCLGIVETHGRAETEALLPGLERIPPRALEYHGIRIEELDVDAVLARRPAAVVIDELAHTNAPGSRNPKRFQDVMEILHAGIHVISAVNIQHLESLYDTMRRLVGVKVGERIPDFVLSEADQLVHVDLSVEDLEKRLAEGRIYASARVPAAMAHFFQPARLAQLRELALWETASRLEQRLRENEPEGVRQPDQVLVAVGAWGRQGEALLRYGSRLAGRLQRKWYAVHVQTPSEDPVRMEPQAQRQLSRVLTLANELGAAVFTLNGEDVADTLLRFAEEYGVGHLVLGRHLPGDAPLERMRRRWFGQSRIADRLLQRARGISLVFYDGTDAPSAGESRALEVARGQLCAWLHPGRVLIRETPVARPSLIRDLVDLALPGRGEQGEDAFRRVMDRERQASTFLNEGIALPHARIDIAEPILALALLRDGLEAPGEAAATEWVLLILTPENGGSSHLALMSEAVRAWQDRGLRRKLRRALNGEEAIAALREAGA